MTFRMDALIGCLAAANAAWADVPMEPGRVRMIGRCDVVMSFGTEQDAPVDRVELWLSRDARRTWTQVETDRLAGDAIRFQVAEDGMYDAYLILECEGLASAERPAPGAASHVRLVVDTTRPLLQLHNAKLLDEPRRVRLGAALIEENLSDTGVRVFHRSLPDTAWLDGGLASRVGGGIEWTPPKDLAGRAEVRVVVTDLAGNEASDQIEVALDPSTSEAAAKAESADKDDGAPIQTASAEPITSLPEARRIELGPTPATDSSETQRRAVAASAVRDQVERLRDLGLRFVREGRNDLAVARFEDGLALAPDHVPLLCDLGSAHFRAGRYDAARSAYERALTIDASSAAALEGQALIAGTDGDFAAARTFLARLLEVRPQDGQLLMRLGDVEHRLGNRGEALRMWRRALDCHPAAELRSKIAARLRQFDPASAAR
jgi:Flp pilus assembly protein TadD